MRFLIWQLQQLGMVAVVMVCALGGTVGILKVIKKITPGDGFPKDPLARKIEDDGKKSDD